MHLQQYFAVDVYTLVLKIYDNITAMQPCWSVMHLGESVSVMELDILYYFVLFFLTLAVKAV